jgi:alpha-1,3-mannosyltransferase
MSLFVLRLFNDAVQVMLMYISILLFARNNWSVGCLIYSASVSVKMNALLYAPGLAVLLCQALGPLSALAHVIFICCGFQAVVGLPFLLHAPESYLTKAFEFSRVFQYKWSVNGAFLSESNFLDRRLSAVLVITHILTLLLFGHLRWTPASQKGLFGLVGWRRASQFGPSAWLSWARNFTPRKLRSAHVVFVLFSSNFIGIVFARTLHFQFYLWYFHTIPLLVAMSSLPITIGIAVFAVIELVFNIYPPQSSAALALSASHLALLFGLFMNKTIHEMDVYQSETNDAADLHSRDANPQDVSSFGPQDTSSIGRKVA